MTNKRMGLVMIVLSSFFFTVMATAIKFIPSVPTYEKIFFRNMIGAILLFAYLRKKPGSLKPVNFKLILVRSIFGLVGMIAYFYAISNLPLANAVILYKLDSFFFILLSVFFLGERISGIEAISLFGAFLGTMMIIRPQMSALLLPSLVGLSAAFFTGCSLTVIRIMRKHDRPELIVFYFSLLSSAMIFPLMLVNGFVMPDAGTLGILSVIALSALAAQVLLTKAYAFAPASDIAVYGYSYIVFTALSGFLVFSEVPDIFSIVGGLLIVGSGYVNLKKEAIRSHLKGGPHA